MTETRQCVNDSQSNLLNFSCLDVDIHWFDSAAPARGLWRTDARAQWRGADAAGNPAADQCAGRHDALANTARADANAANAHTACGNANIISAGPSAASNAHLHQPGRFDALNDRRALL